MRSHLFDEFIIYESNYYKIILYRFQILSLIRTLKRVQSNQLAGTFWRMIGLDDYNRGIKTNFDEKVSGKIKVIKGKERTEFLRNQREIDQQIEAYYGKRKI